MAAPDRSLPGFRAASGADVAGILDLRDEAARWMVARGVRQWVPGELPTSLIADQVASGEWFVVDQWSGVSGAVRVTWSDPTIWGPDDWTAGYLHGLVTRRRGQGLGGDLLARVERLVWDRGGIVARLDCVADNDALRSFYLAHCYRHVGNHSFALHRSAGAGSLGEGPHVMGHR